MRPTASAFSVCFLSHIPLDDVASVIDASFVCCSLASWFEKGTSISRVISACI
jgi:hypothetical protein